MKSPNAWNDFFKVKNYSLTCIFRLVEVVDMDTRPCHHMLGPEYIAESDCTSTK